MKKYSLPIVTIILALGLVVTLTYVIARAQGEDGKPTPGTWPTTEEDANPVGKPVPVEDASLAPDQGDYSLRIPGVALRPRSSEVGWGMGEEDGCIHATDGDATVLWNTPVYLPQGSTVKRMRMYVYDTHEEHNSHGFFTVYDLYGRKKFEWGIWSSGDSGNGYYQTDIFTHKIDYVYYSYVVNWQPNELGDDMQICSFRLFYDLPPGPIFLPLIGK